MSTSPIKFEDLPIEALTAVAQETFEEAVWATEKALAKQLEFGRVMLIVKSKLPYGEWGKWVRETFADQMSLRSIQVHMKAHEEVAQNPALLECASSLDDILKITAKPRTTKTEPDPDSTQPGQPSVQPEPPAKPPREPRKPQEPHQESTPIAAAEVFHLGERLDEDRSTIMEMAGDYMAAGKLKHFVVMLHKAATDLEATA